ncbi:MAG: hypothetical protein ACFCVE_09840 [Phycisphaerae bacterium]
MSELRMGELLRQIVPLSEQQVEEILVEQRWGQHRFGDTALVLGYCRPEHMVAAWRQQMQAGPGPVDLGSVAPEPEALAQLSPETCRRYGVLPLRSVHTLLLLAAAGPLPPAAKAHLRAEAGKPIRTLDATPQPLAEALARAYPASTRRAA